MAIGEWFNVDSMFGSNLILILMVSEVADAKFACEVEGSIKGDEVLIDVGRNKANSLIFIIFIVFNIQVWIQ